MQSHQIYTLSSHDILSWLPGNRLSVPLVFLTKTCPKILPQYLFNASLLVTPCISLSHLIKSIGCLLSCHPSLSSVEYLPFWKMSSSWLLWHSILFFNPLLLQALSEPMPTSKPVPIGIIQSPNASTFLLWQHSVLMPTTSISTYVHVIPILYWDWWDLSIHTFSVFIFDSLTFQELGKV